MSDPGVPRWRQRLENFQKAMDRLRQACALESYSDLERAGLIQTFEFSFELGWKTLKDLLFHEGYDEKTPRAVIRRAFEAGHLDEKDTELWLEALGKRNLLSHTYEEEAAELAVRLIKEDFQPLLARTLASLLRFKERP